MTLRLSRISLVATIALVFTLIAFGNITDFGTNLEFVRHTLRMDTTFGSPALMWRAIEAPALHVAAYLLVIVWEAVTAVLCWAGAARMWRARRAPTAEFDASKSVAIAGLTIGFLLYAVGFLAVAGEWFAMWQSESWNAQETAHIFAMLIGVALLHTSGAERGAAAGGG